MEFVSFIEKAISQSWPKIDNPVWKEIGRLNGEHAELPASAEILQGAMWNAANKSLQKREVFSAASIISTIIPGRMDLSHNDFPYMKELLQDLNDSVQICLKEDEREVNRIAALVDAGEGVLVEFDNVSVFVQVSRTSFARFTRKDSKGVETFDDVDLREQFISLGFKKKDFTGVPSQLSFYGVHDMFDMSVFEEHNRYRLIKYWYDVAKKIKQKSRDKAREVEIRNNFKEAGLDGLLYEYVDLVGE
jgi:hypothetical protein